WHGKTRDQHRLEPREHPRPEHGHRARAREHHGHRVELPRARHLPLAPRLLPAPGGCGFGALLRVVVLAHHAAPSTLRIATKTLSSTASSCDASPGNVSASTTRPSVNVSGKPTAKTFSCGALRAIMPRDTLATSSDAAAGSATSTAASNISLPQAATSQKPAAPNGSVSGGISTKLSTSSVTSARWPSNARKTSVEKITKYWPTSGTLAPRSGSTTLAKASPIDNATISPPIAIAPKTICSKKPSTAPINASRTATSAPASDSGSTGTGGGSTGATTSASTSASATRTRTGTVRA